MAELLEYSHEVTYTSERQRFCLFDFRSYSIGCSDIGSCAHKHSLHASCDSLKRTQSGALCHNKQQTCRINFKRVAITVDLMGVRLGHNSCPRDAVF